LREVVEVLVRHVVGHVADEERGGGIAPARNLAAAAPVVVVLPVVGKGV